MADDRILIEIDANDQASEKIRAVSRALNDLDKDTSSLGNNTGVDSFDKKLDKFYRNASKMNTAVREFQSVLSNVTNVTKRLVQDAGSAIWDFTSDSIKAFDEFSEAQARTLGVVAAQYDNTAASQAKFFEDSQKLKQQALTLGGEGIDGRGSLETVTEISDLQLTLARAGVTADEMLSPDNTIIQDIIKFARGNDIEMTQAAEFAVSLGNQFDIPMSKWGDMLDKVSHTADLAPINVQNIMESMKYAGGITSGLDRDMEETLAMVATLGNFGLKGSQAGSGIQALMTRLLTQDTTVITDAQAEVAPPNALKAFYDFSKYAKSDGSSLTYDQIKNATSYESLGELSGNLRPMDEVVDQLDEVMSGLNDEEQAWFAKKFFGLYQMKAAYGLMSGEEQDLNQVITEIKEQSVGSNQKKYDLLFDSAEGRKIALDSAIEAAKIDLGDRLSPFTNKVRDELINFLNDPSEYEIDFSGLHDALDEACDLIEEKFGSGIADAVRNLGDFTIDFTQVTKEIAPEFFNGIGKMVSDLTNPDGNVVSNIFSAMGDWGSMIDNMHTAVDGLPEELQGLGDAVVGVIDWMGKLMALDIASEFVELLTSLAMVGAMTVKAGTVLVNGNTINGASGGNTVVPNTSAAGLSGKTVVGSADDVARAFGLSTDDVVKGLGESASYTIDDIAKGFGTSVDDVISGFGSSIDDVIKGASKGTSALSRGIGSLSKAGKALGVAGTALQVGVSGYEAYNAFSNNDEKGGWNAIASGGGSLAGGAAGAAIGSAIFPGVGTIIGGIIGSLAGGAAGGAISDSVYDAGHNYEDQYNEIMKELTATAQKQQTELNNLRAEYERVSNQYGNTSAEALRLKYQVDELETAYSDGGETIGQFNNRMQSSVSTQEALKSSINSAKSDIDDGAESVLSLVQRLEDLANDKSGDHVSEMQTLVDALNDSVDGLNLTLEDVQGNAEKALKSTRELLEEQAQKEIEQAEEETYKQLVKDRPQLEEDVQTAQENYDTALQRRKDAQSAFDKKYKSSGVSIYDVTGDGPSNNVANAFFGYGIPGVQAFNSDEKKEYMAADTAVSEAKVALENAQSALDTNTSTMNDLSSKFDQRDETAKLDGLGQQIADQINTGLTNGSFTIEKADVTGELNIPNIASEIASKYPGWNALSDKGKEQVIQNAIDNNITIDDSVTMTPSFNVSAPNVNVNVKVDQAGNVTKNIITTPGTGSLLDSLISKTSSQYGQSNNASQRINRGQR